NQCLRMVEEARLTEDRQPVAWPDLSIQLERISKLGLAPVRRCEISINSSRCGACPTFEMRSGDCILSQVNHARSRLSDNSKADHRMRCFVASRPDGGSIRRTALPDELFLPAGGFSPR